MTAGISLSIDRTGVSLEFYQRGSHMKYGRLKELFSFRETVWRMAVSQLKNKYSRSLLGVAWAVINPVLIMLAVNFVFVCVFKTGIKDFSMFILAGIYPWFFFSNAVSEAAFSVLNQKSVLRQFNLPTEIIPLASVLGNFLNFLIGWIFIYPLFLWFRPQIITLLPLLVVGFFVIFLFVFGAGLIASILNVYFRDIGQLLPVALMFWFWITPVFYSVDMVPPTYRWICDINPMTPMIAFYRGVLFEGRVLWNELYAAFFIAVIVLMAGWGLFLKLKSNILKKT
jgi:ABC-2 type transport system permease protein